MVAASAATLGVDGVGEEGVRAVIRLTARTSFVLFNAAFAASALAARWPGRSTRWLLANRRQVGVSFAASHFVHLLAILALTRFTVVFGDPSVLIAVLGYVAIAAMTVTSFDRTAAWLGPRRWQRLHMAGGWYLWFIFFASFAPRVGESLAYAIPTLWMLAVLAVRLRARRARRPVVAAAAVRRGSGA